MGQEISSQTQSVINRLPEKVARHVGLVRESGYLSYEEFLGRVAELNEVTAKLAAGQQKHLLFEVQPGSDASALWKVSVRIVCTKACVMFCCQINKENGLVEASRIMNLYQFIQLYKDITGQAAAVMTTLGDAETSSGEAASEECCICMEGRADLTLPCAHSFCQKCIDKWSDRSRHCPICRLQVAGVGESWVMSDAPTEEDIANHILHLADEAGQPLRP